MGGTHHTGMPSCYDVNVQGYIKTKEKTLLIFANTMLNGIIICPYLDNYFIIIV